MQNLTIALVQVNQIWENKPRNLGLYEQLISKLKNIDLIVLPEMFNTSFSMKPKNLAEEMNDSHGIKWLKKHAKQKQCAIYTSLIIKEHNKFFNRGVFIYPDGNIDFYDKRKCFSLVNEGDYFKAGDKEKIVSYLSWNINLQICYDLRFPLNVINSFTKDESPKYDLLIYVANWPEKRIKQWDILLKARAIENQCFVLGVNRTGTDGNNIKYSGNSVAINPIGKNLSTLTDKETVIVVKINKKELINIREKLPFLKDH